MQWWNEFVTWIQTTDGHRSVFLAVVILLAVVIGVVVTAAVFRGSIARLIRQQEHERKNAVIATLIDAAVDASAWNVLTQSERILSDRASAQAETHLRLLPIKGSGVAANWAAHELAELKHTASTGGYQTQASIGEFRDRLVQWRDKPSRARKAFLADLERWRFSETSRPETPAAPGSDSSAADSSTESAPASRVATPVATSQPAVPAGPVVVGSSPDEASDTSYQRPATPTIVLPPAPTGSSHDETRQLLDDVDRLDVPSRERPVEELPPVEHAPVASHDESAAERTDPPQSTSATRSAD
ncbi:MULTISPECIES: hypothetical protein [unclassified Rathayibacter]|uniref:hypothetical protein n=1 Tax=unclassified Rathayibacter TaxID=2609250 RepID=UPI0006F2D3C3|nr:MULTISPECIES: hypothetical protein [unclassified Rathayibacter]KQQ00647.1 hypothetical protein ASF42_14985 [Rathayibacter sp. Leaf294]KQS10846.1 hypothetical protein ASG06_14985 [Rathayibacter sp. Leaf185]